MPGNQNAMLQKQQERQLQRQKKTEGQNGGQGGAPELGPNYIERHYNKRMRALRELEQKNTHMLDNLDNPPAAESMEYQKGKNRNLSKHERNKLKKTVAARDKENIEELKDRLEYRDQFFTDERVELETMDHNKYLENIQLELPALAVDYIHNDLKHRDVTGHERRKRAKKIQNGDAIDLRVQEADIEALYGNVVRDQIFSQEKVKLSQETKTLAGALDGVKLIEEVRKEMEEASKKARDKAMNGMGVLADGEFRELMSNQDVLHQRAQKLEAMTEQLTYWARVAFPQLEKTRQDCRGFGIAAETLREENEADPRPYTAHLARELENKRNEAMAYIQSIRQNITVKNQEFWNLVVQMDKLREQREFDATDAFRQELDSLRTSDNPASNIIADQFEKNKVRRTDFRRNDPDDPGRPNDEVAAKQEYERAVKELLRNIPVKARF